VSWVNVRTAVCYNLTVTAYRRIVQYGTGHFIARQTLSHKTNIKKQSCKYGMVDSTYEPWWLYRPCAEGVLSAVCGTGPWRDGGPWGKLKRDGALWGACCDCDCDCDRDSDCD
jgi:hypothetical protein